jgi:crotonyl-CoA carboxylase/reductase
MPTGKDVTNVKVGDEVVMHCGKWNPRLTPRWSARQGPDVFAELRRSSGATKPTTARFAQFTKVQGQQCMPKPTHLTWEEPPAAYTLVAATAWRMLHGWPRERAVKAGDRRP